MIKQEEARKDVSSSSSQAKTSQSSEETIEKVQTVGSEPAKSQTHKLERKYKTYTAILGHDLDAPEGEDIHPGA